MKGQGDCIMLVGVSQQVILKHLACVIKRASGMNKISLYHRKKKREIKKPEECLFFLCFVTTEMKK